MSRVPQAKATFVLTGKEGGDTDKQAKSTVEFIGHQEFAPCFAPFDPYEGYHFTNAQKMQRIRRKQATRGRLQA